MKSYSNIFSSLNTICDGLIPLPNLEMKEEKRNLILEDKDLDYQDIILSFKKITGCPSGKYKLNFSFELNKKIISENLDFCNENSLEWNFT